MLDVLKMSGRSMLYQTPKKGAVYRKSEQWVNYISFISTVAIKPGAQMPELSNMIRLLTLV